LSKRYQLLEESAKDFSTLNLLTKEDIRLAFSIIENRNDSNVHVKKVDRYLNEINNLVGLDDVKITFNKIIASLKVERLKKDRSISSIHVEIHFYS
jgi:hypothetical protein